MPKVTKILSGKAKLTAKENRTSHCTLLPETSLIVPHPWLQSGVHFLRGKHPLFRFRTWTYQFDGITWTSNNDQNKKQKIRNRGYAIQGKLNSDIERDFSSVFTKQQLVTAHTWSSSAIASNAPKMVWPGPFTLQEEHLASIEHRIGLLFFFSFSQSHPKHIHEEEFALCPYPFYKEVTTPISRGGCYCLAPTHNCTTMRWHESYTNPVWYYSNWIFLKMAYCFNSTSLEFYTDAKLYSWKA